MRSYQRYSGPVSRRCRKWSLPTLKKIHRIMERKGHSDSGTGSGTDQNIGNSSEHVNGLLDRTRRMCGNRDAIRERDGTYLEAARGRHVQAETRRASGGAKWKLGHREEDAFFFKPINLCMQMGLQEVRDEKTQVQEEYKNVCELTCHPTNFVYEQFDCEGKFEAAERDEQKWEKQLEESGRKKEQQCKYTGTSRRTARGFEQALQDPNGQAAWQAKNMFNQIAGPG